MIRQVHYRPFLFIGRHTLKQNLPQHVAIIMDGNGRWAEHRGLSRSEGHRAGVRVIKEVVKACMENGVRVLSVWAFGQDNWARPTEEVDFLMQLFVQSLEQEVEELHTNGVCLRFTGDRSILSQPLQEGMALAEKLTAENNTLTLNVVINYSGKWDVLQASKRIAADVAKGLISLDDINEAQFSQYLNTYPLPDPDLFIRTSGERRVSNFFLWQLSYTELYFTDVFWPDFTCEEFEKALLSFKSRERRFGKTSQQIMAE